jgi:hypothetical protein
MYIYAVKTRNWQTRRVGVSQCCHNHVMWLFRHVANLTLLYRSSWYHTVSECTCFMLLNKGSGANIIQGCDFPAISTVVQYLVPESLEVWMQRAGRASQSSDTQARAILMVQRSVFTEVGKDTWKEDEPKEYSKNINGTLRRYIEVESENINCM